MASLAELLKEEENAQRDGWKDGAWFPHRSFEGGRATLAYGHKLDELEAKGGYVVLPDGSVVDFDDRGLTEAEALALFKADVSKNQNIAKANWNAFVSKDFEALPKEIKKKYDEESWGKVKAKSFDALDPMQQAVLTEISFNTGDLKKKDGTFEWPSLAKAIANDDVEEMKAQLLRKGWDDTKKKMVPLTKRTNAIRGLVDTYYNRPEDVDLTGFAPKAAAAAPDVEGMTGFLPAFTDRMEGLSKAPAPTSEAPVKGTKGFPQAFTDRLEGLGKAPSQPSQSPSEAPKEAAPQFTEAEEAFISAAVAGSEEETPEEVEFTPAEEDLMERLGAPKPERASGTEETQPPVRVQQEESVDDSKDPTYGIF